MADIDVSLQIGPSPAMKAEIEKLALFFEKLDKGPGTAGIRKVQDAVHKGFLENFTAQKEGGGLPWGRLRPRTVWERRKLGFAGERPILVRTGRYRASFFQRGASHHEEFAATLGRWVWREGSNHPRHNVLERGRDAPNPMVARPVTILSDRAASRIGDVLDYILSQLQP